MSNLGATSVAAQGAALNAGKGIGNARVRRGASWFYWIAGLSVVNSIIVLSGSNVHFLVGLGITEAFDAAGKQAAGVGSGVALAVSLVAAGVFAMFGYFGRKMQLWAFVVGGALYLLDAGILVAFADYFGAAFHAYVLYRLYLGLAAAKNVAAVRPASAPLG
jgi:hypothetical protein